jgi:WD40 repeat protein
MAGFSRQGCAGEVLAILILSVFSSPLCAQPELRVRLGHAMTVYTVAVSPDGRYALSGSGDNGIRLWSLETGLCLRE